jgi:hypothetical protein
MNSVTMKLICRSWMERNKNQLNKDVFYFTNTILLLVLPQ